MALVSTAPIALLVHGWNDDPNSGWLEWLATQLRARGYEVLAPHFQQNGTKRFNQWQDELNALSERLDARSVVIAHSLGCWLTLRMLASLTPDSQVGQMFLVAGFYDAPRPEAKRFFEPEPSWPLLKQVVPKRVVIYSDDDQIVTLDRSRRLAHQLDAELVCVSGCGHFLGSRGMDTFPELLDLIT